jgi:hypothetical protein
LGNPTYIPKVFNEASNDLVSQVSLKKQQHQDKEDKLVKNSRE